MRRKPTSAAKREKPAPQATVADPDITLPPEARPIPGRPFFRYTFSERGTHVDVDASYDVERRRRQLAELIALEAPNIERGLRFGPRRPTRGRSRIYREAVAVLAHLGKQASAKAVATELERRGVVSTQESKSGLVLVWRDDAGRTKRTDFTRFAKQISEVRKDINR